jgi:hypothetical protein
VTSGIGYLSWDGSVYRINSANTNSFIINSRNGVNLNSSNLLGIVTKDGGTGASGGVQDNVGFGISGSAGNYNLMVGTTDTGASAKLHLVQAALTSAWIPVFRSDPGAHTGMTANTEFISRDFQSATQQWATGAFTNTQRFNLFGGYTIAFVGASTATRQANVSITGPVRAGTNATITTSVGLDIATVNVVNGGTAVTAAYAAYFDAPTGATTNYALGLNGKLASGTAVVTNTHHAFTNQSNSTNIAEFRDNADAGKIFLTNDGRFYGANLHNNAGAVTGTTNQYVASGTYTPTLTNVTNVAASTAAVCQWIRVGNVVTVTGRVDIDITTTLLASELGMSLPIASAIANDREIGGTANAANTEQTANIRIRADVTNDRAQFVWINQASVANIAYAFTFSYVIL